MEQFNDVAFTFNGTIAYIDGAILRLLRTPFDGNELCFKCIRGVVSGVKGQAKWSSII